MNRIRKRLFLGGAIALLLGNLAWAQVQFLSSSTLSGNEVWSVANGGPGGSSFFVSSAQIRNSTGYLLTTLAIGPLTPTTAANRIIFNAALTGGVTLGTPVGTFDGEMLEVVNGTGSNFTSNIVVTASTQTPAQTVNSGTITNLTANSSAEFQFVAGSTNTWFRIR